MAPAVSVVIPCYNAESFLRGTLDSVFCQTFTDLEVVVVDDGSTDGSQEIIKSYGERVKALFGPNRGASAARNRGTSVARGEFIQYLDADDLLATNALQRKVEALQNNDAEVAYSDWQFLDEQDDRSYSLGTVQTRKLEEIDLSAELAILKNFWAPPAALLYRRSVIERIGCWNESLPIIQDARFLLDAALHGARFIHVADVLAFYRRTHGSLSRGDSVAFVRDCFTNAVQVYNWWRFHGDVTMDRRNALLDVLSYCARASFERDRETFDAAYEQLIRIDPHFRPRGPLSLKLLSKCFGYRRAERVALAYRRTKKTLGLNARSGIGRWN